MVVFPHFAADIPATIDNEAVHEAIETADRVIDEAKKAAEEASKNSAAALSLAKQIDLEKKRIARLWFWQRPANWREFGGERARYQGYSSVGPDGRLFANGNGCWDFS